MKTKLFLLLSLFLCISAISFSQNNNPEYKKAEQLLATGNLNEAIEIYKTLLDSEPNVFEYRYDLAWGYLNLYEWEKSIENFNKALEIDPTYARCYSHIGRAYYEKGDNTTALKEIQKGFDITDTVAHLYMTRGLINHSNGKLSDALLDYNQAITLDPNDPDYYIVRANYNIDQNYPALAYSDVSSAIELVPDSDEYYYYRAYILMNANMLEDAYADINMCIELDPENPNYYNLKSSIYQLAGDFENAEICILKSLELKDDDYLAWTNLGDLYFQLSKLDDFCNAYDKALPLIPEDMPEAESYVKTSMDKYCDDNKMPYYFVRALAVYNESNYEKCIEILDNGLTKLTTSSVLENLKATCMLTQGNYVEAEKLFNLSLEHKDMLVDEVVAYYRVELNDGDEKIVADSYIIKSHVGIAMCGLFNKNQDLTTANIDKGIKLAENIEVFEEREVLYNVRGLNHISQGNFDSASADFELAVECNKEYSYSFLNIALVKILSASKSKSQTYEFTYMNDVHDMRMLTPKMKKLKDTDDLIYEALVIINEVIKNDSTNAYAYLLKSKALQLLGDSDACKFAELAKENGIDSAYSELGIKCD